METISLTLSDDLLKTSGQCAKLLQLSRAEYIRRALMRMNSNTRRQLRAKRLADASKKVRLESMRVNAEFEDIEHDPYCRMDG